MQTVIYYFQSLGWSFGRREAVPGLANWRRSLQPGVRRAHPARHLTFVGSSGEAARG